MYSALNGPITPQVIFPALSLLQNLFQLLHNLPGAITGSITAIVSYKRILEFLELPESETLVGNPALNSEMPAILVQDCSFEWEKVVSDDRVRSEAGTENSFENTNIPFQLKGITLSIPIGKKCGIVGPVGCGKSTFLSALIGEVKKTSGAVSMNGSIGYCSQEPWILSESILENILFEKPLDRYRLKEILNVCALDTDLQMFPDGLRTEIGEKGVNLSGGQKSRVALARAIYFNPDILLLDDPISALDPDVGRQVFQNAIKDYLDLKTVVLVTHQLHLLPELDYIIVMDKGVVVEQGTYDELINRKSSLAKMMKSYSLDDNNNVSKEIQPVEKKAEAAGSGRKFMVSEDQAQGSVDLKVFWHYFDKCGGWVYVISFIVATLTGSALSIFSSLWLSWWSSNKYNLSLNTNMLVYGILGAIQFSFSLFINVTFLIGAYKAARFYHTKALQNLLNSTMGFFDSQPVGRILNRLSKDIESMDQMLWMILFFAMFMLSQAVTTLIFLIYLDFRLSALVIPLTILYFFILKYYQKSNIEFKRFESSNKSPLYAHISETLTGLAAVKAFGVQKSFVSKQRRLMDFSNVPTFLRLLGFVWVSIRLQLLSSTVVLVMCILGISSKNDPALMGLAIS